MKQTGVRAIFLLLLAGPMVAQEYQLSKPIVKMADNGFFQKQTEVALEFKLDGAILRYTLDDTDPTRFSKRYKKPIKFNKSGILKVKAFKKGFLPSDMVFHRLMKVEDRIRKLDISPLADEPYAGEGRNTLTDLKAGSLNFRDGHWLGYNKGPITINIDLGESEQLKDVTLSTMISPGSWIFPPESMQVLLSEDGNSFVKYASIKPLPLQEMEPARKIYHTVGTGQKNTRFIRVIIHPIPELPDWHPGKGHPGWVFLDEVIIR